MATNKDAQTRYLVLDKCFSNPFKRYFMEDLVEACSAALLNRNPDSRGVQRRRVAAEEDNHFGRDFAENYLDEGFKLVLFVLWKVGKGGFHRVCDFSRQFRFFPIDPEHFIPFPKNPVIAKHGIHQRRGSARHCRSDL